MDRYFHLRETIADFRRRQWVCLFLAFFLLYNPFFAKYHAGNNVEICCPASHRATVGSSELKHLTSAAGQSLLGFADLALAEVSFLQPALFATNSLRVLPELYPPEQLLCASLWFRPPPAS